jgi:hypothetical protein
MLKNSLIRVRLEMVDFSSIFTLFSKFCKHDLIYGGRLGA